MSRKTIVAAVLSLVATAALAADPAPRMSGSHEMPMHRDRCSCQTDASAMPHGKHMREARAAVSPDPATSTQATRAPSNIDLHPEDYR